MIYIVVRERFLITHSRRSIPARLRLPPEDYLARSDSYGFFDLFDHNVILTGPTGINVRDLRVVLTGISGT